MSAIHFTNEGVGVLQGWGGMGAPAISHEVAYESSIWKVMLGVSGMRLETAFPGV